MHPQLEAPELEETALAVQPPAPPAPGEPPKKRPFMDRIGGKFLFISILAHLLFGLVAAYFVVQRIEAKRKLTFQAASSGPRQSAKAVEYKVKTTRQKSMQSAPPTKRITTNSVSARVAIPAMDMPTTMDSTPSRMQGMAGAASFGTGTLSAGAGGGGAGGKGMPFFGLRTRNNAALVGTLYDFKQKKNGNPTDMEPEGTTPLYYAELHRLVKSGFAASGFGKFFEAPNQLYTTQLFIPRMSAEKCPEEFGVADKVKPKRWVIHYKARVIPPVSGRYHFVGNGDDILLVRFDGHLVLDGSLHDASGGWSAKRRFNTEPMVVDIRDSKRATQDSMAEGDAFEVRAGIAYDMDVIIGECPGGEFQTFLLIEKEGESTTSDKRGNPLFPIFKLAPSTVAKPNGPVAPYVAPDTTWSVWGAQPPPATGLDFLKGAK